MKRLLATLIAASAVAGAAFPSVPVQAAAPAAALSGEEQALVDRAASYLQALRTVQGRFTQTSSRGGASGGTFSMQRPGRARFEYDPPAALLIVSDGYNVKVYDRRLRTFDQYPLGSTPLVLLLAREVRLDRGVVVTRVRRTAGGFSLTARDARRQAEGSITLEFADAPVALRGWTVIDAQGVQTQVRLGALREAGRLDPGLFQLQDPRVRTGPR